VGHPKEEQRKSKFKLYDSLEQLSVAPMITQESTMKMKEQKMNHKKLLSRMLALILVGLILASCGGTATLLPPTATAALVPPTATTIPSPTATPAPIAIPGSHDSMTVGDFTFQITEVQIADTLTNLPAGSISNYKGALKMTASGWVPADAKTGDKLLMVFTTLQSGNFQNFIDSNLKVVDGNSEISIVAILTQADNNIAIWVYGVNPASKSFLLVFPDGVSINLAPITP
jgi:hypothetical protein